MSAEDAPIVVGYDGSDGGRDALVLGQLMAEAMGRELVLARVLPVEPSREQEAIGELEAAARSAAGRAEPVAAGSAARGLHQLAERLGAELLVVGSSTRGVAGRVLAGSTGERLLQGSACAVALAPIGLHTDEDAGLRVLGVAFDGSPESQRALRCAIDLGTRAHATMRIFTVVPPEAHGNDRAHELWRRRLAEALAEAPDELRAADQLLSGDPAHELVVEAEKGVDLLVMGSRGYGPLMRVLLGGVALQLVRSAPCPLLILPRGT